MAISKQKKNELVNQYVDWINNSQAFFFTEYKGLTMKNLDDLRKKARDIGGEFHIVKNTLSKVAFDDVGLKAPDETFIGTTAIAIAYDDAPAMAKVISDFARESDFIKIKCGYLEKELIDRNEIIALAELPPLPVLQAKLLGTIMAPASKLTRTLAEPARQVVAVINAYATKENANAAV